MIIYTSMYIIPCFLYKKYTLTDKQCIHLGSIVETVKVRGTNSRIESRTIIIVFDDCSYPEYIGVH